MQSCCREFVGLFGFYSQRAGLVGDGRKRQRGREGEQVTLLERAIEIAGCGSIVKVSESRSKKSLHLTSPKSPLVGSINTLTHLIIQSSDRESDLTDTIRRAADVFYTTLNLFPFLHTLI